MDKLTAKFLEEASEHIHDIEQNMLLLEKDTENPGYIEIIFRAMHTLKGAGSMFGFENISELTHDLENIYDKIRSGSRTITREVFDLTLDSIDHLKTLLKCGLNMPEEVIRNQATLIQRISEIMHKSATDQTVEAPSDDTISPQESITIASTYYICFKPDC